MEMILNNRAKDKTKVRDMDQTKAAVASCSTTIMMFTRFHTRHAAGSDGHVPA